MEQWTKRKAAAKAWVQLLREKGRETWKREIVIQLWRSLLFRFLGYSFPLSFHCVETLNNQQKVWPDAICVFLAPGLGLWQFLLQFLLQFLQFADTANGNCLFVYLYDWLGMCLVVYLDFMVAEAELWNISSHNKASNCMNFTVTDSTSLGFRRDHSADWAVCMHISNNLINCLLSLRLIYCMRLLWKYPHLFWSQGCHYWDAEQFLAPSTAMRAVSVTLGLRSPYFYATLHYVGKACLFP